MLGLDTSARAARLALADGGRVLEELILEGRGGHENLLGAATRRLLEGCGCTVGHVGAVAVGLGPGSYTGCRIGVTFAKTFAHALRCPLVGLSGLQVQARDAASGGLVVVVEPAHRERVYGAVYDVGPALPRIRRPVAIWDPPALLEDLEAGFLVAGGAAGVLEATARARGGRVLDRELPVRAGTLALLAARALEAGRSPDKPHSLVPLYLQRSAPERGPGP